MTGLLMGVFAGLVLIVAIPAMAGVLITAFASFNMLLGELYTHNREAWEWEGRPAGFLWKAPGESIFSGHMSRNTLIWRTLFGTPDWISSLPNGPQIHRRFRICALIWNLSALMLLAFMMVFGPSQNT